MRISGKKNNHDSSDKLDPKSVDWRSLLNTIRRISRIGEQPSYRIEGRAFVYADREAGRIITILGYPTAKIAQLG